MSDDDELDAEVPPDATGDMKLPPPRTRPQRGFGGWLLLFFELAVVIALVGAGGAIGWANWSLGQARSATSPAIDRGKGPEALARGERLFVDACARCHADPGTGRAIGA